MKKRLLILILLLAGTTFPLIIDGGKSPINVSTLVIQWNSQSSKFEALFSVTNDTKRDQELSCILRFRTDTKRRWRGAILPLIPPNSTEHFKIAFPADLMLKNDYTDISVILYEKRYSGFIDNSGNYVRINTSRYVVDDQYKVKISQTIVPDLTEEKPQKEEDVYVIGSRETVTPLVEKPSTKKPVQLQALVKTAPVETAPPTETSTSAPLKSQETASLQTPSTGKWIIIDPRKSEKTAVQQAIESKELPETAGDVETPEVIISESEPETVPIPIKETVQLLAPQTRLVKAADGKVEIQWTSKVKTNVFNVYWSEIPLVTKENGTKVQVTGNRFLHQDLINDQKYYYAVSAVAGSDESPLSNEIEAEPKSTAIVETPIEVLLSEIDLADLSRIEPNQELTVNIANSQIAREETLKRARALEASDLQSREKLISLYIAEGKSEDIAELLSNQLDKDPENIDLSLSLSKVYHEQGDTEAALNVLTASLNRISLSARLALNQELKTSVKEGQTTIKGQTEESFLANEFLKLGVSLMEREKYEDALSAFQSLHSLVQDYPLLQYYMGRCRQGLNQYNQAKSLYIAQTQKELDFDQNLTVLSSLTEVLPKSLELQDVDYTVGRYKTIAQNAPPDKQPQINQQLEKLGFLMVKARDKRFGNLADLVVEMPGSEEFTNVQPGQDIVVKLAVENVGRKDSNEFNVYYQLKHESGIFYEIPDSDRFKEIQANSTPFTWEKQIVVPQKAITGKYQLVVNIEQVEGTDEITLNNNTLTSASNIQIIPPIADLAMSFREKPNLTRINRTDGVIADLVVTNKGYLPSPAFNIEYQLENRDGEVFTVQDRQSYQKIKKRDSILIEKKRIALPEDFQEGIYSLKARLILENESAEINKKNNATESGYTYQVPDRFDGRPQDGVAYYTQLIINEPNVIRHRIKLSRYYRIMKQDETALSVLNQASVYVAGRLISSSTEASTAQKPPSKNELRLLKNELKRTGDRFAAAKDFQNALTSYQSLQTLDSDYPLIHRLTGQCRIGLGQYALAKNEFLMQADKTPDFKSLYDLREALSYGNDLENMVETRKRFLNLEKTSDANTIEIDRQIAELNDMIEKTKVVMSNEGSDLIIAFENPPGTVAIRPNDTLELEFSLNNLGKTLSNPVTVHYQFISESGNVYDSDAVTGFDKLDPKHKTVFWDEDLVIPENIVGGNYRIRASLEFDKNMADKDELNNQVVSDYLFVYSEPDIAITNFSHKFKQINSSNSVITTQLTWENRGGNPATQNRLLLFLENVNNTNDRKLLKEEQLSDAPAISATIVMSDELVIPRIEAENKYKLIAEIKSEGELKENILNNNRYESIELIGNNIEPVVISGLNLNTRVSYPGKEIDLEVRLRNNQQNNAVKNATLELRLQDELGNSCCSITKTVETIPPSLSVIDSQGNVVVKDFVYKSSLTFPGITRGQYWAEARLKSTAEIPVIERSKYVRSLTPLYYGDPTFRVTNFYPIRDILIPGKEVHFNITLLNNGENKSKPENLNFYLEGNQTIPIGELNIEPLDPSQQSITLNKSLQLPQNIALGTYTLVLRKNETTQGSAQVLRYRNTIEIQNIQPIAPQEFESFKQNEAPIFSWNSIDNLSYRLAFSTDPRFQDNTKIFRIPDNGWIDTKNYKPGLGEWNIIWLLSRNVQQDVYWQIEAKSDQNRIFRGIPQKILLKREVLN